MLNIAFAAQPALAHDPPVITPTRLDFDAAHAPKNCNDRNEFESILSSWIPPVTLRDDAERRLDVRIRWTSTGGKRADVSLVDARGVTLAERHTPYANATECHKVLWAVARDAAKILGAFEPPPPKEPVTCPAPQPCVSCPPARPCATFPPLRLTTPAPTLSPAPYRSFIGIGGFVGSGIFSKLGGGPYLLVGYAPFRRLSQLHVEFEGSWTSQTSQSIREHSIPLVGSLCWVQGIVRFCGGFSTSVFFSNQPPENDELRLMLGGNFRVGTELLSHGPFSIRADVFGRLAFAQRRFGKATVALDEPTPFAAGVAVIGVWAFD